jgi:hypothetical protein
VPEPDPLGELRDRLRATREAAERLAGEIPPQGWATHPERNAAAEEIQALVTLLHALREVVPPDLWEQVREVVRQLLLLVRALLDAVVERLEEDGARPPAVARPGAGGPAVQDIPVA